MAASTCVEGGDPTDDLLSGGVDRVHGRFHVAQDAAEQALVAGDGGRHGDARHREAGVRAGDLGPDPLHVDDAPHLAAGLGGLGDGDSGGALGHTAQSSCPLTKAFSSSCASGYGTMSMPAASMPFCASR